MLLGFAVFLMAFFGISCALRSTCITLDPQPAVLRLQSGGSIQSEVDRLAKPLIEQGEIHGVAVGILTPDGTTHSFDYGLSGKSGGASLSAGNDIFQIGSLTKLFVTAMLDILVSEGTLRYEDTVRSILPANVPLSPGIGDLTLKDLVTHTSGLPRESRGLKQLGYGVHYLFTGHNPYSYVDKKYLYHFMATRKLKPESQRKFAYSNVGFAILTHLIEIKTGRSVQELLQEKICGPLKMKDTVFELNAEQKKRLVIGRAGDQPYFFRRHTPMAAWDLGEIMRPVGGLYSTVNDLMTFAKANLWKNLDEKYRVKFQTPIQKLVLGWTVERFANKRAMFFYSQGMVSGYSAYMGLNPDQKVAVVVLYDEFNWNDEIGQNLLLRLSEGFVAHPGKQAVVSGHAESTWTKA
ncbi:MAG: hypothetical protein A2351_03895 [Omnitrophica bacterium RIFOXYB12_FULL_50_7]|nr:MAG: hypothetical protein A2351_03895 [Omnitrophica bacterium RIFOXYB12_FULL_50_7]